MAQISLALCVGLWGCEDKSNTPDAQVSADLSTDSGQQTARDSGALDVGNQDAEPGMDALSVDFGTPDSGAADMGFADAMTLPDMGPPDLGTIDMGPPDLGTPDQGLPDSGACNYILLDAVIVDCGGTYRYARVLRDQNSICPDVVELNGQRYPDIRSAIGGEGCNSSCIYQAGTSVSFIDHCGRRNGYIIYRASGMNCPELFEFSNGLYLSVSDWEANTPC